MKNILLITLFLSASLTYSLPTAGKMTTKHEQSLYEETTDYSCLEENDFNTQNEYFHNTNNQEISLNGWKLLKGLAGLWLGTKLFFAGGKGIVYLTFYPEHTLSQMMVASDSSLSTKDELATKRFMWISLFTTLTAFSSWMIKKSADNLYEGIYSTENNLEWLN